MPEERPGRAAVRRPWVSRAQADAANENTMHFDFSQLGDVQSFVSIPPGTYLCRVADVREGFTVDGSVKWSLRLEVAEGDYAGRTAAWDVLSWSERGIHRVRRVLGVLGFDVRGEVDLKPDDLVGLRIQAQLETEERHDPSTGQRTVRLRVPYSGYTAVEGGEARGISDDGIVDAARDGARS